MVTYISMLRGINVSGQKRVNMEELSKLYRSLGFGAVRTYVQSGNVIFESPETDASKVTSEIERGIRRTFGFEVPVLVRTRDELERAIKSDPLKGNDESKLHVTFLSRQPLGLPAEEIAKSRGALEKCSISGREVYLFCPDGYGKTKLSNGFFERKLKTAATTRNWKTVNALLSLSQAPGDSSAQD